MPRRLVVFFEGRFSDPELSIPAHSLFQSAAWLVDEHGFDCSLVLWTDSRLERLPAPLARVQVCQLQDLPPSNMVSTIDIAGLATGVIERFAPDLILFSATPDNGSLHLLGAACAFLQPADFLFSIVSWSRQNEQDIFCSRPSYEMLLRSRLEFPAVIGVTYHHGVPGYPLVSCPDPESLPMSGLGMELELLQMRSALMPEPVSLLHFPDNQNTELKTALDWFGSDEQVD